MAETGTLRVLIADERGDILDSLATLVREAGHDPVACEVAVDESASAVEREHPDVAIVGIHADVAHALDLLDVLSAAGEVPVVAVLGDPGSPFLADAADLGLIALAGRVDPGELANALRLAHKRGQDLATLTARVRQLEQRMARRAVLERAKGVLMERHDLGEPEAYDLLRRQARDERQPLTAVCEAVLRARRLLPPRGAAGGDAA